MRTSATGTSRPKRDEGFESCVGRSAEHGFTLVELMVVLLIVGLAAGAVAFAMPDPRGDLRHEAERFAARARAAQDAAVIEARDMALWVGPSGYGFERRERGRWTPLADKPFAPASWSRDAQALVPGGRMRIVFDTTGGSEPLALALVRDGARVDVRIEGDGTIDVAR